MNPRILFGARLVMLAGLALVGLPMALHAGEKGPKFTVVMGNLLPAEGGVASKPGPLKAPFGVDWDSKGTMYIVELGGGRVFELSKEGKLAQMAGDGSKSYKGDGGPAKEATFNGMHNVAVGANDDIYISDTWNNCIRKIDAKSRTITTVAGTGKAGFGGDGGPATKAMFNYVMCVTFNKSKDKLYIADINNRRNRVMDLKTGVVQTVAGNGQKGVPRDGDLATDSPLIDPRAVAIDSKNNVYVLERGGHALRIVRTDGKIYTVAGTGTGGYKDGPAQLAELKGPKHLCVDDDDNVYIADDLNGAIRKYDPVKKAVSTVAGKKIGTPPIQLLNPHGVAWHKGTLYIVDMGHDRILKME